MKNKEVDFLNFDIQMFAEADNADDIDETEEDTSSTSEDVDLETIPQIPKPPTGMKMKKITLMKNHLLIKQRHLAID